MIDGLLLKLSTDLAVEAQKRFEASTESTFKVLREQGAQLDALQKHIDALSAKLREQSATSKDAAVHQTTLVNVFGTMRSETDKTAKSSKELVTAQQAAGKATGTLGQQATGLSAIMSKLLSASGNTGAARGIGILGTAARGLVGALNPLGIVTGVAAAALISLAADALNAETPLDRLQQRAKDASQNFDLMAASGDRLSSALANVASKRGAIQGFVGPADEAQKKLEDLASTLRDVRNNLDTVDTPILNIDQIKNVAEALKLPNSELRDLQRLTTAGGKELDSILARLRDSGLKLQTETQKTFLSGRLGLNQFGSEFATSVTMEATDALNALQKAIDETDRKILNIRNREHDAVEPFQALTKELLAQAEAEKLGNKERDISAKILVLTKERNGQLTEAQQNAARTARTLAKIMDEEAASEKKLAEQKRILLQEQQRQAVLDDRRADVLRSLSDQANELFAVGEDEIRQKQLQSKLNSLLAQTETDASSAAGRAIKAALERVQDAEKANRKMLELKALGEETFGTIGQNIANAVTNGSGFRTLLQGIAQDLEKIALQKTVVEALARLGGSLFSVSRAPNDTISGLGISSQLRMNGGLAGSSWAANGLLLDRFQTFVSGGRRITTNEGGAATPEAIFPLQRDSKGRLGLAAAGGGGTVIVNMPNVRSAADARSARPTVRQVVEQAQRTGTRGLAGLRR